MELSAKAIRDVQFRERLRGYHPDDVDDFVSEVAAAVEQLLRQVEELTDRAAGAERRVEELATTEESLQRTLVLAQRTADLALREAREEAASLVAQARAERDALATETEELRRRLADEAQADVRAELARLQEQRDGLRADVDALTSFVETERARLRGALVEQLRRLDEGDLRSSPPPPLHDVDGTTLTASSVDASAPAGDAATAAPPSTGAAPSSDGGGAPASVPGTNGDATAEPGAEDEDSDEFLAELRRAVTDTSPLGPRDDEPALPSAHHEHDIFEGVDEEGGRFTSRLRRRR